MIRITGLSIPVMEEKDCLERLKRKIKKSLRLGEADSFDFKIKKKSIDARKKGEICFVYTVDVLLKKKLNEEALIKKLKTNSIMCVKEKGYEIKPAGEESLKYRPIVVGAGPAGLFCAYELALFGLNPLVIERGKEAKKRKADVEKFWESGVLDVESNVQFGEGGAGTFSDGKLNTMVKDPLNRNSYILSVFEKFGAPSAITYDAKPHIGTDILIDVVENMRKEIISLGGEFIFEKAVKDFEIENGKVKEITLSDGTKISTEVLVLAPGHSARDLFFKLQEKKIYMEPKAFAVGFRMEHPQRMINESQYHIGVEDKVMQFLPPSPYKVTANFPDGRGVYSFCMCPGGYVVNSSSEEKRLTVNGMSYSNRASRNANSAIIVSVNPSDFKEEGPLGGIAFQREIEAKAYELGNGKIPQQLFGDFVDKRITKDYGDFDSEHKGAVCFADLNPILGEELNSCIISGVKEFGKKIKGFDRLDAIFSGVEARTSSPLRILRDENFESSVKGIYPCGEGAGYAGGITSAAMDGLKVAEKILEKYKA